MYVPEHFHEIDPAAINEILQTAPLACIVANTDDGLIANHLPLMAGSDGTLVGHVALNNDLHRLITPDQEVIAIFRASDAYVSPNDYPSKQVHHRHVPTWNYQVVHIYGQLAFTYDEKSKRAAVGMLTQRHERLTNQDAAWRMADAPKDYMQNMLANIVAFKMTVTRTVAKSKLGQNREAVDLQGAITGLDERGHHEIARQMQKRAEIKPTSLD